MTPEAQPLTPETKTLIRGADIVTLNEGWPDVVHGDLLVVGDRIATIAATINAPDAEVCEGEGRIVLPGLVNAHLHSWQTGLRGACADWAVLDYLRLMHGVIGPRFTPEDLRLATLSGALNQINCGTTTLGDWCHNNPTPDHTDAAIAGLRESGIRALFMHGSAKPEPKPGQPHFSAVPHSRVEVERLRSGALAADDALVTLGMAILGPHFSTADVACQDFRLARELDLVASMHQGGGEPVDTTAWAAVEASHLLGPKLNIVHANNLADDQIRRLVEAGASFTCTPEVELSMGHGIPIINRLLRLGGLPSLGVDVESVISGELLTVTRFALAQQHVGSIPVTPDETSPASSSLEALRWATLGGAKALGLDHRVGSLAVGKQADLVMIDTRALNLTPVNDVVATILQASLLNIEAVMIGGVWRKRAGQIVFPGLQQLLSEVTRSGRRILQAVPTNVQPAHRPSWKAGTDACFFKDASIYMERE